MADEAPGVVTLVVLALIWAALIVFETLRFSDERTQARAARAAH